MESNYTIAFGRLHVYMYVRFVRFRNILNPGSILVVVDVMDLVGSRRNEI